MLRRTGLQLIALGLVTTAYAAVVPQATHVTSLTWEISHGRFGGMSGIDTDETGTSFIALSDAGSTISGTFQRDHNGDLTGIDAGPLIRLVDEGSKYLENPEDDSEGIAISPDGGVFVSFELDDRIEYFDDLSGPNTQELRTEGFTHLPYNKGLEALAVDADGALYTLPEQTDSRAEPFPVFRYRGGAWDQPFAIRRDGDWLPVGADFGPDGRLYLLERNFWPMIGFMSRVRRFEVLDDQIAKEEILLETAAGIHDNLEGLAVWRDGGGDIRLTMVSDDNFLSVQKTEIVEYRVRE